MKIKKIDAEQILDSRGNPTVAVTLVLENGIVSDASIPSGASKGTYEATELRDGNPEEYNGLSVHTACNNVHLIFEAIKDIDVENQRDIDLAMIALDGTKQKTKLGANATLAVSFAAMKASATLYNVAYYEQINAIFNEYFKKDVSIGLPTPLFNILNGGQHATNGIDFQEFIATPIASKDMHTLFHYSEKNISPETAIKNIEIGANILHSLSSVLKNAHIPTGGVGDEGGYAPSLKSAKEALNMLCEATIHAGYKLYDDVSFGIDCASNYFYDASSNEYIIEAKTGNGSGFRKNVPEMVEYYEFFIKNYPLIYLEDYFAEDSWNDFSLLTNNENIEKIAFTGDDLVVTNIERLQKAIENKSISSVIIKPNQIGTLYETMQVVNMCMDNDILYVPSHRSGETTDPFITDIAVGLGAKLLKAGAPQRGERVAKYNRLLEISKYLEK